VNFNEPTTVEEAAELSSRYGNIGRDAADGSLEQGIGEARRRGGRFAKKEGKGLIGLVKVF
jgi:hypothetical protein